MGNFLHPNLGLRHSVIGPIAQAKHQKGIGQTRHTQTNAPLCLGLARLCLEGKTAGIHHVIHHPHSDPHQILQRLKIKGRIRLKGRAHKPRKVNRAKQTRPIGRQRLFAARVGCRNGFAIGQIIGLVDAIDENHTWLSVIIGRLHNLVPQVTRLHRAVNLVVKHQFPRPVCFDRLHKGIGDENRDIEHPQPRRIRFGGDKIFDVWVVAAHRCHHRAAARASRHNRAAHGIPNIHKTQRARGIRGHPLNIRAFGSDGREIIADPAPLLHRQSRLFEHIKNAAHAVGDCAHDKAIEKRDTAPRSRTRRDATSG